MDEAGKQPILLVEDNLDDIIITRRAWEKAHIKNKLITVHNGEEALSFLRKEGVFSEAPTPCLILLDLKMPKMDGFEFLKIMKGDETLKIIPVIVLTSSNVSEDITKAYSLGCNSYIQKPVSFMDLIKTIVELGHWWLTLSKTPVF